jgi:hypothetical protein
MNYFDSNRTNTVILKMVKLGIKRWRPTDCCLICTCLSVRNFENAINKSYTYVQPHCIVFFFQCRTGVVADCFKFCAYTSDLVTAEPEVNIGSSRRGPFMILSETPSNTQMMLTCLSCILVFCWCNHL